MATTPNYGWVMPDPTDFVTNLPADFEVFGDAVDADLAGLLGGTTGQVLTKNSAADHNFSWANPATGGMTLIATATPSAATAVSFTSIPTTYKTLILIVDSLFMSDGTAHCGVRLNNDSATAYYWAGSSVVAGSADFNNKDSGTSFGNSRENAFIQGGATTGTTIQNTINGQFWIFNADQTTGRKSVTWQSYSDASQVYGTIGMQGVYTGTSAISRIDFVRSSTQTITGTVRLYGIS